MRKAIVIGAGIGGLATAVRLRAQGYEVAVYEAAPNPGGKLNEFLLTGTEGHYRFDAGPSLFTMPERIEELFKLSGRDMRPYFSYRQLDDVCHYFYSSGKQFTAWQDLDRMAQEMEAVLGEPAANTKRYLKQAAFKYEAVADLFLYRSLHQWQTWLSTKALGSYLKMPWLDLMTTMDKVNGRSFKTPEARQLFNRYATYNGSDPYKTPGLLALIPHLECNKGAYFPSGGMYDITKSIYRLAQDMGVTFSFNAPVAEILHTDRKATGIKLADGRTETAEVVVSNLDIHPTYHRLLPKLKKPEVILNQQRSSSALIFYWGIAAQFKQLGLHNILFSSDYPDEFAHIFDRGTISPDPTLYINITSKLAPQDAPQGHENWFMMINVPNNNGQDWSALVQQARGYILKKASQMLGTDIEPLIRCEHVLDPVTIESRTGSYQGSLYGNASNSQWSAFFRHNNRHTDISGLYFVGGSVHPGGGIPLALASAQITADLVRKYE